MLRKIIYTEETPLLVLDLPQNLQGRRIEIIAFAIDDEKPALQKLPAATFAGTLSTADANDLRLHVEESRNDWNNDFTDR